MKAIRFAILLLPLLAAAGCGLYGGGSSSTGTPSLFIYVVGQNSQNVFGFEQLTTQTVDSLTPSSTATTLRPASLLVHPDGEFAYVANFGSNDVTKYSRDATTGLLTPLGSVAPSPVGTGPISVATDSKGQFLYVLNQGSGSISAFSIDQNRGLLTELAGSPFPTQANPVAFINSSSNVLYVAAATTVSAFAIASDGTLSQVAGSPFATPAGTNLSWVTVDPKARFVYAADFANSLIVGYAIQSDGSLIALSGSPFGAGGTNPAGLVVDSTSSFLYVANQGSNSISGLSIAGSGALTIISGSPFPSGGTQTTFVTIDPTNAFIYDTNNGSNSVGVSSINTSSGALTQSTVQQTFTVSTTPSWVTVLQVPK